MIKDSNDVNRASLDLANKVKKRKDQRRRKSGQRERERKTNETIRPKRVCSCVFERCFCVCGC